MEPRSLSTAAQRSDEILDAAVPVFAAGGYWGATIAQVGEAAGVSPAYVFKLFTSKAELFAAVLRRGFGQIDHALRAAADEAGAGDSVAVLDRMAATYAALIQDRSVLLLQVHGMSAAHESDLIATALREGIAQVTRTAAARSGAHPSDVQRFIAFGQLCHLLVMADVSPGGGDWADILTHGIRHLD